MSRGDGASGCSPRAGIFGNIWFDAMLSAAAGMRRSEEQRSAPCEQHSHVLALVARFQRSGLADFCTSSDAWLRLAG